MEIENLKQELKSELQLLI